MMSFIKETLNILYFYITGTYNAFLFIVAMELGMLAMNFTDQEIYQEFTAFFQKWHTLFLAPIVVGPILFPFTSHFFKNGETPNILISIVSLIGISQFGRYPEFVIVFISLICLAFIVGQNYDIFQSAFSVVFSFLTYALKLYTDKSLEFDFNFFIYSAAGIGTLLAIITQYKAKTKIDDSKNYHALLVRNIGFVLFDMIIYFYGVLNYVAIYAFLVNLFINFLSQLMVSYGISFCFSDH